MAKPIARSDLELVKIAKEHALDLLKRAFAEARDRGTAAGSETQPPLFPKGIEHIHVTFDLGVTNVATVKVEVELSGPSPGG